MLTCRRKYLLKCREKYLLCGCSKMICLKCNRKVLMRLCIDRIRLAICADMPRTPCVMLKMIIANRGRPFYAQLVHFKTKLR